MNPPSQSPRPDNEPEWRRFAACYLADQFPERPPADLSNPTIFSSSPLEGEGPVVLYEFSANPGNHEESCYFVAVGKTVPNYYPAYGLDVHEAYDLHLGTRFMLVMGVGQADSSLLSDFNAAARAREIVDRVAPGEPIEGLKVSSAFEVAGQLHVVLSCTLGGERVFLFAGECPPGFSRRADVPPNVVYRIHLGRVLRGEPGD